MYIVNDKETEVVIIDKLFNINIHSDNKRIIANSERGTARGGIIGTYNNKQQTQRAFGMLLKAIEDEVTIFYMPKATNPQLNTQMYGSSIARGGKTIGKTK